MRLAHSKAEDDPAPVRPVTLHQSDLLLTPPVETLFLVQIIESVPDFVPLQKDDLFLNGQLGSENDEDLRRTGTMKKKKTL